MEQVMKHYGNAILAVIVLLALGAIIVAALQSDGYVAMEFKNTLTGFFDNMNALRHQEEAKKMEKEIESGKDE